MDIGYRINTWRGEWACRVGHSLQAAKPRFKTKTHPVLGQAKFDARLADGRPHLPGNSSKAKNEERPGERVREGLGCLPGGFDAHFENYAKVNFSSGVPVSLLNLVEILKIARRLVSSVGGTCGSNIIVAYEDNLAIAHSYRNCQIRICHLVHCLVHCHADQLVITTVIP